MFIDLKELRSKIGSKLKLTLKSEGVYTEKQYNTAEGMRTFNVFDFQVEQSGEMYTLGATDALKRKIDDLDIGDSFLLSWEEFTKNGELRNYWKIEQIAKTENEFNNFVAKKESDKKVDHIVSNKVVERSHSINNGARLGMIFNNTFRLYMHFDMAWTTDEFVSNFHRVSKFVKACEDMKVTPPIKKTKEPLVPASKVVIKEDDLPF